MGNVIKVREVSKKFRIPHEKRATLFDHILGLTGKRVTYDEFWALKNISFNVEKGSSMGLIGKNGSGKSTLLRLIGNIYSPTTGSIETVGRIMPLIGLTTGMQLSLTGKDNIFLYGSIMGIPRKRLMDEYDEIVEFAELGEFMDLKLRDYSSGMLARLAFSIALATDPDIMLIDEVLAVGDLNFRKKCMKKIDEINSSGKSILFVSHQTSQVKSLCDTAIFLDSGKIKSMGDTDKVVDDYLHFMALQEEKAEKRISPFDGPIAGTGEIMITSLRTTDSNNKEKTAFSSDEPLILEIGFKPLKPVERPVFMVQVLSPEGKLVYGTNTQKEKLDLGTVSKEGRITLNIARLPFPHGRYTINLGVFREGKLKAKLAYHFVKNAGAVFVTSGKQEFSRNQAKVAVKWNVT